MTLEAPTVARSPSRAASVLELRQITIRYNRAGQQPLAIIDNYSLSLTAGDMHCLAGRSGSGKTSILRVAAGLTQPTSGEVFWAGLSITGVNDDIVTTRRRDMVGYLDQGGVLVPGLTALENVLLPAVPSRRSKALLPRASDLLARLGVNNRATTYPEKLSGGERQRASADGVIRMLRELADDGIVVLVAAHDPNLIEAADTRTTMN
jgi:ABC-type lipoprotein export system ATPase subunit